MNIRIAKFRACIVKEFIDIFFIVVIITIIVNLQFIDLRKNKIFFGFIEILRFERKMIY